MMDVPRDKDAQTLYVSVSLQRNHPTELPSGSCLFIVSGLFIVSRDCYKTCYSSGLLFCTSLLWLVTNQQNPSSPWSSRILILVVRNCLLTARRETALGAAGFPGFYLAPLSHFAPLSLTQLSFSPVFQTLSSGSFSSFVQDECIHTYYPKFNISSRSWGRLSGRAFA